MLPFVTLNSRALNDRRHFFSFLTFIKAWIIMCVSVWLWLLKAKQQHRNKKFGQCSRIYWFTLARSLTCAEYNAYVKASSCPAFCHSSRLVSLVSGDRVNGLLSLLWHFVSMVFSVMPTFWTCRVLPCLQEGLSILPADVTNNHCALYLLHCLSRLPGYSSVAHLYANVNRVRTASVIPV